MDARKNLILRVGAVAATLFLGCKEDHDEGKASEAVCPQQQTLTYENFGKAFFQQYCTRCHAKTVMGADRKGAPGDHNFDSIADIRPLGEHIDEFAAAGPGAVNTLMPPTDPKPTEAERRKLGEWLACGAP